MRAYCKKYYPYYPNDIPNIIHQSYLTGKTYDMKMFYHMDEKWYRLVDEKNSEDLFSLAEFNDYFYDIAEHRKKKLKKLKL